MKSSQNLYKISFEVILLNYNDYKNARDASWKILIDMEISELPIKITDVCRKLGIAVFSYSRGNELIHYYGLSDHSLRTDGFTICPEDSPTIFYNGDLSPERCRFTIAHELGHLVLGHIGSGQITVINREPRSTDNPQETAANVLASRLLAPACVLWGLKYRKAEDIAELCDISLQAASFRAERMDLLYRREEQFLATRGKSCFLLSPLERQVYAQFKTFIDHKSD